MNRIDALIECLKEDYHCLGSSCPKLNVSWKKEGKGEGFSLKYGAGSLILEAESPKAAIYGISFAKVAASSGHIAEYLGEHAPRLPLRSLWIKSSRVQDQCRKILSLGYNGIVVESSCEEYDTFRSYGIQVIRYLHPGDSEPPAPFESDFIDYLQELTHSISDVDYLFWESTAMQASLSQHPKARNYLFKDIARLEIAAWEKVLNSRSQLIYFLPSQNAVQAEKMARWIPALSQEITKGTILAFSSTSGEPERDDLEPHPLWKILRESNFERYSQLMPIVNAGLVGQGEGLWPCIALDQIEAYLTRCSGSAFKGSIVLTHHLPREEALLSCNLWTAAQTQWKNKIPSLLVETWIQAFRPDLGSVKSCKHIFDELRKISIQLSRLIHSPLEMSIDKTITDHILTRLRSLQLEFASEKTDQVLMVNKPGLRDYFTYFARDARRLTLRFLQERHMPAVNVLENEDVEESFWTGISLPQGQKLVSTGNVTVYDKPNPGKEGSMMRAIYEEVVG